MTNNIITYPNQKIIKINREVAKSDFLGIKNLQAFFPQNRLQNLFLLNIPL